jgi:hypothetical protein
VWNDIRWGWESIKERAVPRGELISEMFSSQSILFFNQRLNDGREGDTCGGVDVGVEPLLLGAK